MSLIQKLSYHQFIKYYVFLKKGCQENNPADMKSLGQVLKLSSDVSTTEMESILVSLSNRLI